eukprot:scaffold1066_cov421-Prasinococcus_capsulatus_cf.AAC.6
MHQSPAPLQGRMSAVLGMGGFSARRCVQHSFAVAEDVTLVELQVNHFDRAYIERRRLQRVLASTESTQSR